MVELRKRKEAPETEQVMPLGKKTGSVKSSTSSKKADSSSRKSSPKKVAVGDTVNFESFGGEIETHDGEKTTLKKLVENSKTGVVIFTYPKASTPGCTTQACLFRDEFTSLTATGLSIYGLSTDSPKSNTNFKTKQSLPYTLLCDPKATLIAALGLKKAPSGTTRGVFVVNKDGRVEIAEPGGPAATMEAVKKLVRGWSLSVSEAAKTSEEDMKAPKTGQEGETSVHDTEQPKTSNGDAAKAEVAAEVADTAEKLDRGPLA